MYHEKIVTIGHYGVFYQNHINSYFFYPLMFYHQLGKKLVSLRLSFAGRLNNIVQGPSQILPGYEIYYVLDIKDVN